MDFTKLLKNIKDPKVIVGIIVAVLGGIVGVSYVEGQTIYYDDGTVFEVPEGKKIVMVPEDTPRIVWTLGDKVKLKNPKPTQPAEPSKCEDGLVIGPTPCDPNEPHELILGAP